jgi:hypothetical protein
MVSATVRTAEAASVPGGDEQEEAMDGQPDDNTIRPGEVLTLTQRSARRRAYELRRGDQVVGWLQFPPGRRSVALGEGDGIGSLVLIASSGRVEVRGGPDAVATIATVEHAPRGAAVIRTAQGPALGWRRTGRWHRWAIDDGEATLLRVGAVQGLLRSSVRITAQQKILEQTTVLLCLIGAFLALRSVQTETDAGAAVGGIVAAGAG